MSKIWDHIQANQPKFAKDLQILSQGRNVELEQIGETAGYTPAMIIEDILRNEPWMEKDLREGIETGKRDAREKIGLSIMDLALFEQQDSNTQAYVFEYRGQRYRYDAGLIREDLCDEKPLYQKRLREPRLKDSRGLFKSWRRKAGL